MEEIFAPIAASDSQIDRFQDSMLLFLPLLWSVCVCVDGEVINSIRFTIKDV